MRPDGSRYYVLYDHPSDYQDHYVIRPWNNMPMAPFPIACISESAAELRKPFLDYGFVPLIRMEKDDPVIMEIWF